jgi:hypothetical protein
MSVIRVNPESVTAYAGFATERFAAIRAELEGLTREVVGVRYFGPNAVAFKTECGELATQFSQSLLADLGQIADAVRASTSSISAALGGAPVTVQFDGSPVVAPGVDAGDGSVDIDTSALEALRPVVSARFGALQDALQQHLSRLEATDWQGTAKSSAVDAVGRFTATARSRASEAESSIVARIDAQVSSVLAADR